MLRILLGAGVLTVIGLVIVAGVSIGRVIVGDGGSKSARDRNGIVQLDVPNDWDVDASPVGGEKYGSDEPDVVPDLTVTGGGLLSFEEIEVWIEDPVGDAAAHGRRQRAIAVEDCAVFSCDALSDPRPLVSGGYPALEQVMTVSDEYSWTLIRTVRTPSAIIHLEAFTDSGDKSRQRLRAAVDSIRIRG